MTWESASIEEAEAYRAGLIASAWHWGTLHYKLHALQQRIDDALTESLERGARRFVVEAGRKVGKTFYLVTKAHELAIQNPGCRIVYGAPTLKHLGEFVHPEFARVAQDAPPGHAPVWNGLTGHYNFPNGSWVHLFGAKDEYQAKNGRGPGAIAAFFDEAGFCDVLPVVLEDVFKPSLQLTRGFQLLSSSPADVPEHPFTAITEIEESRGNHAHASWLENPMLSDEEREAEIKENAEQAGLSRAEYEASAKYRREYLGERVVDPQLVGFPEWEPLRGTHIKAIERPTLFRAQEGLDFGGVDPHFVVFGYWHPEYGAVIEDELVMRDGQTTLELADAIKAKEAELWGVDKWTGTLSGFDRAVLNKHFSGNVPAWAMEAAGRGDRGGQPWMRSRDTDAQLGIDLLSRGLLTIPTRKDNKQLAVDSLRVLMRKGQLWLHPRCTKLDRDLRSTTWRNDRRDEWARRADGSHGDGCDALVYFNRNLERDVPLEDGRVLRHLRAPPLGNLLLGNSPAARKLLGRR